MHLLLRYPYKWMAFFLLLFVAGNAAAQNVTVLSKVLDGSRGQFVNQAFINVQDSAFFGVSKGKLTDSYPVKNIITFHINEYADQLLPDTFTATAKIRLTFLKPDGKLDSIEQTLTINYADSLAYTSRSSFVFNNSHDVTVRLLNLTIAGDTTGVRRALMLKNDMQVQAIYNLNCSVDAVKSVYAVNVPNTDETDELPVGWPQVTGADEYDLEWTFIDNAALSAGNYGNATSPDQRLIFKNNSSRVTVKETQYNIPLFYEGDATLFFRVRAVQQKENNGRLETTWSSVFQGGLGKFSFVGHQNRLNWQANIAFAEEGKRNVTVNYLDGSLRTRQTVTKDNTTNTTIVGETLYDYQGREVIKVMPAPTLSGVIKYSSNFNQGLNGEYDKSQYDYLADPKDFPTASAAEMSRNSGANQYYSPNNPQKNEGNNKYIPDAEGYAFTETSYTQDGTGRVSRQSGLGPVFKLGSNREVKYYYDSPGDNDLDVLFGTDAGDRSHYFKNTIQDANGQMSVTYLDMHGRTVATALAGTADNAALDALDNDVKFPVTDTLSRKGSNLINGMVLESSRSQLVSLEGDFDFHYRLLPPVLRKPVCPDENGVVDTVCYNVQYDLEITITDDVYNQHLGGEPYKKVIHSFESGQITPDCTPDSIKADFTLHLKKGSYQISKRLIINTEAFEYYRDSIFMKNNVCVTLNQFIQQQRALIADTSCLVTCEGCKASVGTWTLFRANYMKRAGIENDADTASYRNAAWTAYNNALEACAALCDEVSPVMDKKNSMLADLMAPNGQYAKLEESPDKFSIFYHKDETTLPPYANPDIVYLDESGNVDEVYSEISGTYVKPQELSPEAFAANFKPSWANALLKFHPEYCRFLAYQSYENSLIWGRKLEKIDTYNEAYTGGYLKPVNDIDADFPVVTGNMDPLSQTVNNVLAKKINMYTGVLLPRRISMYTIAASLVLCSDQTTNCIAQYNTPEKALNTQTMCSGDLDMVWRSFRTMYQAYRNHVIDSLVLQAKCDGPILDTLTHYGKVPRFANQKTAFELGDISYITKGDASVRDSVNVDLAASYESNCNAYVEQWVAQLLKCTYYDESFVRGTLIPELKKVCIAGADVDHITGSSTVKPGTNATFKSFEDVINYYNNSLGYTSRLQTAEDIANCNGLVITAPTPYDKQRAASEIVTYAKPSACECENLSRLKQEYTAYKKGAETLTTYLNRTRGTSLTENQISQLLDACDPKYKDCKYVSGLISIPVLIQCNASYAPPCQSCAQIDTLYKQYIAKYPGLAPTYEDTSTNQHAKNMFFEAFMNNATGYNKQAYEYKAFLDTCSKYSSRDQQVCRTDTVTSSGNVRTYGDSAQFRDLVVTADGGFVLAGNIRARTGMGTDGYLVKTNAAGAVMWARIYGTSNDDAFVRVRATSDGGFVVIGDSKYMGEPSLLIVKTDSVGEKLWSKSTTLRARATGVDILQTRDSGYVFAARRILENGTVKGDIGALKKDGSLKWIFKHEGGSLGNEGYSMVLNNDTLVVAGCVSASIFGSPDKFTMFVNRLNANTGALMSHWAYAKDGSTAGNYSKHLTKTSYGYLFNFTATIGDDNKNIVVGINHLGGVVFSKEFGNPDNQNVTQWSPAVHTADRGLMAVQNLNNEKKVVWRKLGPAPGYAPVTSYKSFTTGLTDVQMLAELPDGRFAAVGNVGTKAMVMLADTSGKVNCEEPIANNVDSVKIATLLTRTWPVHVPDTIDMDTDPGVIDTDYYTTYYQTGCRSTVCYNLHDGPLLCGNANPIYPQVPLNTSNNCTDDDFYAVSVGTRLYNAYRDSLYNAFSREYFDTALAGGQREVFTTSYTNSEYQYTLYYYDQAGNLVKTIPPAGVVIDRSPEWSYKVRQARAAKLTLTPPHTMATENKYNTLNKVITQISPDGGITRFWYDRLGRTAYAQNGKQVADNKYAYTLYDALGRVTEVGEITGATPMTDFISRNEQQNASWLAAAAASRTQITKSVYDLPYLAAEKALNQDNLRNRVSWMALFNNADALSTADGLDYSSATFYSYDIHGNVKALVQDFKHGNMAIKSNRFKTIDYKYDLISGKVNWVGFQSGEKDAFYHRYTYDALNRLTDVETSRDNIYWDKDAFYQYYKHGPLARTVIGQEQVQGIDYAYTLQGWLKGVNSTALTPIFDIGADGTSGSLVAKDAFGFGLHYFGNNDYKPINTNVMPFAAAQGNKPLFNGNISAISQHIPSVGKSLEFTYSYDMLNRLKGMQASTGLDDQTNSWTSSFTTLQDFQESVTYDPNGNIRQYNRNGNKTFANGELGMDSLEYHYLPGTNKLAYVNDNVRARNYGTDIDAQSEGNYQYDGIGNITSDVQANIKKIEWNLYNKVDSIQRFDNSVIKYTYDVTGNRISKTADGMQTWYVRDATGNVISVYAYGDKTINQGKLSQTEAHIYGSNRLGMTTLATNMEDAEAPSANSDFSLGSIKNITFVRGKKFFELTNHLGNVLATVADKKIGISYNNSTLDHYEPLIISSQEYYPFGMLMPGRGRKLVLGQFGDGIGGNDGGSSNPYPATLTITSRAGNQPSEYVATDLITFDPGFESGVNDEFVAYIEANGVSVPVPGDPGSVAFSRGGYRYGFNGQEKIDEIAGEGNHNTALFWEFDTRIGRRWNLDPQPVVGISAYSGLTNNPIFYSDVLGNISDPPWWHYYLNFANRQLWDISMTPVKIVSDAVDYVDYYRVPTSDQYKQIVRQNIANNYWGFWGGVNGILSQTIGYHVSADRFHLNSAQSVVYNLGTTVTSSIPLEPGGFHLPPASTPRLVMATESAVSSITYKAEEKIASYVYSTTSSSSGSSTPPSTTSSSPVTPAPSAPLTPEQKRRAVFLAKSPNWVTGNLQDAIDEFAPGARGVLSPDGVKTIYQNPGSPILIKADNENPYFRIYDTMKKQWMGKDGKLPSTGRLQGDDAKDYIQQQTHILNVP